MARRKIVFLSMLLICLSGFKSQAVTLWVFESSSNESTAPNKKLLERHDIKKIIESEEIQVVYIDTKNDQTWSKFLKSIGSSSVPAIYTLTDEGEVEFLAHIITPEVLENKLGKGLQKKDKRKK